MLGKLMKYDLRSGIRTFSLIWIGLALLGAINGLTIRFVLAGDTQSGLVSFVFGVLPNPACGALCCDGYFCARFYYRPLL